MGICRCTQRACNDTCTTDVDHLVNVLQLEKLNDHGICLCTMTEMSTTTMDCNCGDSTVFCSQKDEDRPQDPPFT